MWILVLLLGCDRESSGEEPAPLFPLSKTWLPPSKLTSLRTGGMDFFDQTPDGEFPSRCNHRTPRMAMNSSHLPLLADLDGDGEMELLQSSRGCCAPERRTEFTLVDSESRTWAPGRTWKRPFNRRKLQRSASSTWTETELWTFFNRLPRGFSGVGKRRRSLLRPLLDVRKYTNETAGLVQAVDLDRMGLDLVVGNHQCEGEYPSVIPILQEGRGNWRIAPGWSQGGLEGHYLHHHGFFRSPAIPPPCLWPGETVTLPTRSTRLSWKAPGAVREPFCGSASTPLPWNPCTRILRIRFGPMSNANPMGMSTVDFNGDGLPDLVGHPGHLAIWCCGEKDGTFTDISETGSQLTPLESRMGRQRIDFDPTDETMCCWSMVHPITRMNPFQEICPCIGIVRRFSLPGSPRIWVDHHRRLARPACGRSG